jgi:hypothetical protein
MAHFAKLDENNTVLEVNVVNNDILDPANEEASGIVFLTEWSGGHTNWKQTSYNNNFRKHYAGIGYFYDNVRDVFIPLQPYPSWNLNENTLLWESPIPKPDEGWDWIWDEKNIQWIERQSLYQ